MRLAVHVTPKSAKDEVAGWRKDPRGQSELAVRVSAAPEKGRATKAVAKLLADYYGVPKSQVKCVRGETSHHKVFELPG